MISFPLLRTSCVVATAVALLGAGCTTPATQAPSPVAAAVDAPASPLELDRTVAAVGTDRIAVNAKVAELMAALRQAGTSQQQRQNICEQLGRILGTPVEGDSALALLAPMLTNPAEVNMGRLALEPVPGTAVDKLFLAAVGKATGATRVALVQSIGNRQIRAAVPALAPLLKDADASLSTAAAQALGQIGTAGALDALAAAPNPAERTVVDARIASAWQLPTVEGNVALHAVLADVRIAVEQRAAALRGLLDREPQSATTRIIEHLSGSELAFKQVAIEAIASHPAPGLSAALGAKLASWDASTQAAVIAALGRKGDIAARPSVATALAHEDVGVRMAAMAALARLPGSPELAERLAQVAARSSGDEAAAALRSLARLTGDGVSEAIVEKAKQGEPVLRSVYLEVIGLRNQTEALPLLFAASDDGDVNVRAAALTSLTDIAPAEAQGALLRWTINATDGREATRALRAFTSVSLRNTDLSTRDRALVEAIDRGEPSVQLRLLPLLARLPGVLTRECAGRLVLGADERVATAALAQLQRWPDATVLPLYVSIAEKTGSETVRTSAIEGALRLLDQGRGLPSAEQSSLVAVLFGTTKDPALRKTLVAVLGRGASGFAQAFVSSLQGEPELAEAARQALASIAANQKWPPAITTSVNPAQMANLVDGRTNTQWRVALEGEQWLRLDLKESRPLQRLTLDQTGRVGDFPTQYEVFVSDDQANAGAPVASGSGQRDRTVIPLPADTHGRYVTIKNSEQRENGGWTVSELFID